MEFKDQKTSRRIKLLAPAVSTEFCGDLHRDTQALVKASLIRIGLDQMRSRPPPVWCWSSPCLSLLISPSPPYEGLTLITLVLQNQLAQSAMFSRTTGSLINRIVWARAGIPDAGIRYSLHRLQSSSRSSLRGVGVTHSLRGQRIHLSSSTEFT